jgi:pyruvate,water dikinase
LREKGKHHLLYLAALGRTVLQLIGQRLVESGTLEAVEDVFFLSLQEVLNGVVDREMGIGRVRERKAEVARFERLEPPPVFTGPIPHYPERGSESLISLKGIASSSGRVTAPARLLHDPAEAERLTVGDILVCPTIDSSWIPLFFSASGIVVEVGGILSHGAIIARELGIPTVINVQGAMSAITDGQRVTVDGGTGEIALLP